MIKGQLILSSYQQLCVVHMEKLAGDLLLFVKLEILSTSLIDFLYEKLGELRSRSLCNVQQSVLVDMCEILLSPVSHESCWGRVLLGTTVSTSTCFGWCGWSAPIDCISTVFGPKSWKLSHIPGDSGSFCLLTQHNGQKTTIGSLQDLVTWPTHH